MIFPEQLSDFFHKHQAELQSKHPGINLVILTRELLGGPNSFGASNLERVFDDLLLGIPLAYITKCRFFYNSEFWVSPEVLIPSFETEMLVKLASEVVINAGDVTKLRIADIGTGCGAIILALLKELSIGLEGSEKLQKLEIDAVATDISTAALSLAKRNYFFHTYCINPKFKLTFLCGDRFRVFDEETALNLIVSNPPYIMMPADLPGVHPQVNNFFPHTALYLMDEDYWDWYKEFFIGALDSLSAKGVLLMEGHELHLQELSKLALSLGFSSVKILQDLSCRDRFLQAVK
ncbi:MAG: peptide chain release factor N(5)-glutamine methyltransferase [Oligoflexia bacterium]|nr:peptide chain release factor N(5)-glutamine methyltransferase [Oligoflexia bacterium]